MVTLGGCCNCLWCDLCDGGTTPSTLQVVIDGLPDCNGTYFVPKYLPDTHESNCSWHLENGTACACGGVYSSIYIHVFKDFFNNYHIRANIYFAESPGVACHSEGTVSYGTTMPDCGDPDFELTINLTTGTGTAGICNCIGFSFGDPFTVTISRA